jgi:phosphoribosylformylglycinamidine cyclo-ligase
LTGKSPKPGLTYHEAGVDIEKASQAKSRIKDLARSTFNSCVISEIGSFAGQFRPRLSHLKDPILVSSADGVGTKLKIAFLSGRHDTVGIDIVSHCTNDILVHGALPLFFLDYIAAGTLQPQVVEEIVKGLAEGCKQSGCVLLGGETAEMPDFYSPGEYDLAGFIVGIADHERLFHPGRVGDGDVLIGLASSGLHTNGYSLVRKLFFEQEKLAVDDYVEEFGKTVGEELLTPHLTYLPVLRELLDENPVRALAHVTGGGITDNLNRALPKTLNASVELGSWEVPAVFQFIQERGNVAREEMYRTFNMGIGMIMVVRSEGVDSVRAKLAEKKQKNSLIGHVTTGQGKVVYQ